MVSAEGWTAIGIRCTRLWNYVELFWNSLDNAPSSIVFYLEMKVEVEVGVHDIIRSWFIPWLQLKIWKLTHRFNLLIWYKLMCQIITFNRSIALWFFVVYYIFELKLISDLCFGNKNAWTNLIILGIHIPRYESSIEFTNLIRSIVYFFNKYTFSKNV